MKKLIIAMLCLYNLSIFSQNFTTNITPVGMEHNILFDATNRYTVTQTGDATVNLRALFDGKFAASYSSIPVSTTEPTVILIENLPNVHVQRGGWIGWSTRYWQPKRFKIEGYNIYNGANEWKVIVDYTNQDYVGSKFISDKVPNGSYGKLRFTIYSTYDTDNKLGLSELFFIHPEATTPYKGLLASESDITWKKKASNTYFNTGNVGIGTTTIPTDYKLAVAGKILTEEVKVLLQNNWPDYVFSKEYTLPSLYEVEKHINEKGHLQNIPSAKEVVKDGGIELGEMNRKLLEKIEELTLYTIQQEKRLQKLEEKLNKLENKN
ncbi:hypothetical protein V1T75_02360 [Tenacibaculum sp. FZY0031]|uniref:hypothetical protein n=1 Tax=Tenacibaculum sp. FZY0031 TaxID=3116648 RepID=UPI002EA09211|nr:hypothetical protein [Tenacibaculum sp. FZY0031]